MPSALPCLTATWPLCLLDFPIANVPQNQYTSLRTGRDLHTFWMNMDQQFSVVSRSPADLVSGRKAFTISSRSSGAKSSGISPLLSRSLMYTWQARDILNNDGASASEKTTCVARANRDQMYHACSITMKWMMNLTSSGSLFQLSLDPMDD